MILQAEPSVFEDKLQNSLRKLQANLEARFESLHPDPTQVNKGHKERTLNPKPYKVQTNSVFLEWGGRESGRYYT